MSKKHEEVNFTFKTFIRLLIFVLIFFVAINFLSNHQSKIDDPTVVLGENTVNSFADNIYQQLPESSRHQIENFNQIPFVQSIQEQLDGFPNKQIKEFQKNLIKKISEDMIQNIEEK